MPRRRPIQRPKLVQFLVPRVTSASPFKNQHGEYAGHQVEKQPTRKAKNTVLASAAKEKLGAAGEARAYSPSAPRRKRPREMAPQWPHAARRSHSCGARKLKHALQLRRCGGGIRILF